MNVLFTPEEISRASRLVKTAGTNSPVNVDAGIASLLGPGSYDRWLGPKSIIDPTPPPRPGFWSSLGRSALGAADRGIGGIGLAPVRAFVGLGPGTSGVRQVAGGAEDWLYNKVTGNQKGVDEARRTMSEGFSVPTQNARSQSEPYHFALANWASKEHPDVTRWATRPLDSFKEWASRPTPRAKLIGPQAAPWEKSKMPPMPKPSW